MKVAFISEHTEYKPGYKYLATYLLYGFDITGKTFDVEINITKIGDKYNAELSFDNSKAVLFEDIFSNPIDYYTGP